jgi:hypothetical protein
MTSTASLPRRAAAARFNQSSFGTFINGRAGRMFRLVAGSAFLVVGLATLPSALGIGLTLWSVLPLSAGAFDVCWISLALGGPLTGQRIRAER